MNTSYKTQIEAIQEARDIIKSVMGIIIRRGLNRKELDSALNDAGSTIAALNLSDPYKEIERLQEEIVTHRRNSTAASNLLGKARDEIKELKKQPTTQT